MKCRSRRFVLQSLVLLLGPTFASWSAEPPKHTPIIGVMMIYIGPNDPAVRALRKGLEDHGYVDGRNVQIAFRGAEGDITQLPKLANELIQLGADVIVVGNEPAMRIA